MAGKSKGSSFLADHAIGIATTLVCSVIIGVGTVIANGIKDNAYEIRRLNEKQEELSRTVAAIKQSVLKIRLSNDPKSVEILGGLVIDAPTAKGVDLYRGGQIKEAVAIWEAASKGGSKDARLAMQAAGIGTPSQEPSSNAMYVLPGKDEQPREQPPKHLE